MLSGKNVVVTGCLQGIGKETLKVFSENGANIFACAYRQDLEYEKFCSGLAEKNGVRIVPVYFDMMDQEAVKEAAKMIQKSKIEIHGLVNIAGINKDAFFNMVTYKDMFDTFQVNFFSQIAFTQYIVKLMQRYKTEGSIVFTSSVTAFDGNEGQVVYGASKAALVGAMKSMALELGKTGIRVNCVAPGIIQSTMTAKLGQDILAEKTKRIDLPRLGETSEVADVYMFLLSELSSHISGQVLRVDGGM